MTLRHLKVFIKVCETGSISKAAEELLVAQPSVSQTIKELEEYYEVILFDRIHKKLVLTQEGQTLLEKAKGVIGEFDDFERVANKTDLNPTIRVGATMSFGEHLLPNFIIQLKKELPEVKPYVYIDKTKGLEERIIKGELDFAITEGFTINKNLKSIYVASDKLLLVASPTFNIPNKIKLKDLEKYNLLLREENAPSRKILEYMLQEKNITIPRPKLESISNNVVISMAIKGLGIGFLPDGIANSYIKKGLLKEVSLDTPLDRKLFIITTKEKRFNKIGKKAYDLCAEILRNIDFNIDAHH